MGNVIVVLMAAGVAIAGFVGWVLNIIAVVGANFTPFTGELLVRVIGIFVAPIGAIMGLFF